MIRNRLAPARQHGMRRELEDANARRILRVGNGLAVQPALYYVLHGQPIGIAGEDGILGLDSEPTACDANFATWTLDGVIDDDTVLPDGFGILLGHNGGLHWACNYHASLTWALPVEIPCLAARILTLPITGSSPTAYVDFLVPHGSTRQ